MKKKETQHNSNKNTNDQKETSIWKSEAIIGIFIGIALTLSIDISKEFYYGWKQDKEEQVKFENLICALQSEMCLKNRELWLLKDHIPEMLKSNIVDVKLELNTDFLDYYIKELTKYKTPNNLMLKLLAYRSSVNSYTRQWHFFYTNRKTISDQEIKAFLHHQKEKLKQDLPYMTSEAIKLLHFTSVMDTKKDNKPLSTLPK